MMETPIPRRPSRAARSRYRALVTLCYPKHEADARARLAGSRADVEWTKAEPGQGIPDWLVDVSPGILSKGRVEDTAPDQPDETEA